MRHFKISIPFLFVVTLQCCQSHTSSTDFAVKWTNHIKQKIIEDASQEPDSTVSDTTKFEFTTFKENRKLKKYLLNPIYNSKKIIISLDTAITLFYSPDQNFVLIRELCPSLDRNRERIEYKGKAFGLEESRYCNGEIKEDIFRYDDQYFGFSKEYDSTGKLIKKTDFGNTELIDKLKDIKYYR